MGNKVKSSAVKPLEGLHVLITRPVQQARPWAEALAALGAATTCQPMLAIKPLSDNQARQAIRDKLLNLDHYHLAIFVSQNAVQHGLPWLDELWPQLPKGLVFFAVGQTTCEQLEQGLQSLDASVSAPGQAMNSEALVSLPDLQNIENKKVLIFRGQGGRTYMGKTLEARGALVDYCELYQRALPDNIDHDKISHCINDNLHTVINVHSGETLENLCRTSAASTLPLIKQQSLLVPGQRVAAIAREHGFTDIIIAENATNESMLEALNDWKKQ